MNLRTPRSIAWLLMVGAALLVLGNVAHPVDLDPTPTSRLALASEASWIPIHLVLAAGFVSATAGLVGFIRAVEPPGSGSLGSVSSLVGGTLLVVTFAALDGFAVARLAEAAYAGGGLATVEAAAVAEEAIDSGVAATGTLLFFGLAIGAVGAGILSRRDAAAWLGWSGLVIGVAGTVAGVLLLVQGPGPFTINVMLRPVAMAGTLWLGALGWVSRRAAGSSGPAEPAHLAGAV